MRDGRRAFAALSLILFLGLPIPPLASLAAETDSLQSGMDAALELARSGRTDQALFAFRALAQTALKQGQHEKAAEFMAFYGRLSLDVGRTGQAIQAYYDAYQLSPEGTEIRAQSLALHHLAIASLSIEGGDLPTAHDAIESARVPTSQTEGLRHASLRSQLLTLEAHLLVSLAEPMLRLPGDIEPSEIDPEEQKFLLAVLDRISRDEAGERFFDGGALSPAGLARLRSSRPWSRTLLERALVVNDEVTELDAGLKPELAATEVAKDWSQRAEILLLLDRTDEAIRFKKRALDALDEANLMWDAMLARSRLIAMYTQTGQYSEAFRESSKLIAHIESQAPAYTGETLMSLLARWRDQYVAHYRFLLTNLEVVRNHAPERADAALVALLAQADRMQFRPFRRNLSVYRELGSAIGADPGLLRSFDERKRDLQAARARVRQARLEGRNRGDYEPVPGLIVDSPFAALDDAEGRLLETLADFKRSRVGDVYRPVTEVTAEWLVEHLSKQSDIVFYFQDPIDSSLKAAVLQSEASPRMLDLPANASEIAGWLALLRDEMAIESSLEGKALRQLGRALWDPLGNLGPYVTIVPTEALIGVPFDALVGKSDDLVVEHHAIRLAFGLREATAARGRVSWTSPSLVIGAATFTDPALAPLPSAAAELQQLRHLLTSRGAALSKGEARPPSGAILLEARDVAVAHVTTHSQLGSGSPQFDALAFPTDSLPAFDLSLSNLRADLVVLSACQLFAGRKDRISPVSGLATAALARIAPELS